MDAFEITVRKTDGGIGSDAWTALFEVRDGMSSAKIVARGSSREEARKRLSFALTEFNRQLCAAHDEVGGHTFEGN